MKVLVIEDDQAFAEYLIVSIGERGVDVLCAGDVESALAQIRTCVHDLIVLDLRLPSRDGALDATQEHGHDMFNKISELAPGTPVRILTSSEPDRFLRQLAARGDRFDVWGSGEPVNTVGYFVKDEAIELLDEIERLAPIIDETDAITINTRGYDLRLTPTQQLAVKAYVRETGGASCTLRQLGGLSGSVVVSLTTNNFQGQTISTCVGKVGPKSKLDRELIAYNRHVKHLKIGAFAHIVSHQHAGLYGSSAVFYRLADEFGKTLFEIARARPQEVVSSITVVRQALAGWTDARTLSRSRVSDIRRSVLDDDTFFELVAENNLDDLTDIEEFHVDAFRSCIHGDLHGANVLVNDDLAPVLIDYGDVGEGYTCMDPITLELSLIFHPDSAPHYQSLAENLAAWHDVGAYLDGSAAREVVSSCRDWAYDVGGSDLAVWAAAYSFAIRQLKFQTVPKDITITFVRSLATSIRDRYLQ